MAFDKVVDSQALDEGLGAVADAIREKTGSAATMTLEQMPEAISGIQTGSGTELPELENPGTASELMEGKQLLDGAGEKVTGTFTIAPELEEQGTLIEQIKTALAGKVVGGNHELPPGYLKADYIQFTGSQFVDTGIIGNQDTRIRVAFAWNDSIQRHVFGCVSVDNTASITSYMNGSWRFGEKNATKTIAKNNPDMLYIGDVSRTRIAITGSSTAISDVADFETVGTLLLGGARDSDGTLPVVGINGKVAEFWIWSAGELVLHLIPVTDGTAFRFWDSVGKKFHDSVTDTPLAGGNW